MDLSTGLDDRCHLQPITCHIPGQVGQNRERGEHLGPGIVARSWSRLRQEDNKTPIKTSSTAAERFQSNTSNED